MQNILFLIYYTFFFFFFIRTRVFGVRQKFQTEFSVQSYSTKTGWVGVSKWEGEGFRWEKKLNFVDKLKTWKR